MTYPRRTMRSLILAAVVFAGCTKSDPQRTPKPDDAVAKLDAGDLKMPAGNVSLKLVKDVSNQPAEAVAWSADGIVTADLTRVVRWVGDQPGTPIAYAAASYGVPRSITLLPDGVVGVGALRISRDGSTIVDDGKLGAAMVEGVRLATPKEFRIGAAAWTADATRLWLAVEPRKAGSRDKPTQSMVPAFRNLVVDAQLSGQQDLSTQDPQAWTMVLAAGKAVVTSAGNLVAWPDGAGGDRVELATAPPIAVAIDPAGTIVATAAVDGAQLRSVSDGKELASWKLVGIPTAIAVATDAQWIATGGTSSSGGLIQLWHVVGADAELAAEIAVPETPFAMAFSPDGSNVVIGGTAQRVVVVSITR